MAVDALPQPFARELLIQTLFTVRGPLTKSVPFDIKRETEAETLGRIIKGFLWIRQQTGPSASLADRAVLIKNVAEQIKTMLMVKGGYAMCYESALLAINQAESLGLPKDEKEKLRQAGIDAELKFRKLIGETTFEDDDVTIVLTPLEKIQGEVALLRQWQEKPESILDIIETDVFK